MKCKFYIFLFAFIFGLFLKEDVYAITAHDLEVYATSVTSSSISGEDTLLENGRDTRHSKLELTFSFFHVISTTSRGVGLDFCHVVRLSTLHLLQNCISETKPCYDARIGVSELPLFKLFNNYRL